MTRTGKSKTKWKLVGDFPVVEYNCGARAGERVRIRRAIKVRDHKRIPTGKKYRQGELVEVLKGTEHPTTIWLRMADGSVMTWSDTSDFWNQFERL